MHCIIHRHTQTIKRERLLIILFRLLHLLCNGTIYIHIYTLTPLWDARSIRVKRSNRLHASSFHTNAFFSSTKIALQPSQTHNGQCCIKLHRNEREARWETVNGVSEMEWICVHNVAISLRRCQWQYQKYSGTLLLKRTEFSLEVLHVYIATACVTLSAT